MLLLGGLGLAAACKPDVPQRPDCPVPAADAAAASCDCPDATPTAVADCGAPTPPPPVVTLVEGERGIVTLANGSEAVITRPRTGSASLELNVMVDPASLSERFTVEVRLENNSVDPKITGVGAASQRVNDRNIIRLTGSLASDAADGARTIAFKDAEGRERVVILTAFSVRQPAAQNTGGNRHQPSQPGPTGNMFEP